MSRSARASGGGTKKRLVNGRAPLGREAWIEAARTVLIQEGIGGVEVGRLARRLRATRGGFYWFFNGRKELLDQLLADWETTNSAAFRGLLRVAGKGNGVAMFHALIDIWVSEREYSPAWDSAVRDWARTSTKVSNAVRRIDDERIAILKQIYLDMGCQDEEAFVRARVCYFHQIGYYTLGVQESHEQRLHLLPHCVRFLMGQPSTHRKSKKT